MKDLFEYNINDKRELLISGLHDAEIFSSASQASEQQLELNLVSEAGEKIQFKFAGVLGFSFVDLFGQNIVSDVYVWDSVSGEVLVSKYEEMVGNNGGTSDERDRIEKKSVDLIEFVPSVGANIRVFFHSASVEIE